MWGGGAFKAKLKSASNAAKASVAAIATGVQKLGVAAEKGMQVAAEQAVAAADWVQRQTDAAGRWVSEKGAEAAALATRSAAKVAQAFVALKDRFVSGIVGGLSTLACIGKGLGSALLAPEIRRDPPPSSLEDARAALRQTEHRQLLAALADDVYKAKSEIEQDPIAHTSRSVTDSVDEKSGFKARLYEIGERKYVLAFAGTNEKRDWLDNVLQGFGLPSRQYKQAMDLTKRINLWVRQQGGSLELTGHSLGGGLATIGAMDSAVPATVFNPAQISGGTIDRYHLDPGAAPVEVNYVEGDILTGFQEHAPAMAAAAGVAGGIVGVMGASAFANYEMGTPVGVRRSLPAVDEDGDGLSYFQASALDRHEMTCVRQGLARQAKDYDAAIQQFQANH